MAGELRDRSKVSDAVKEVREEGERVEQLIEAAADKAPEKLQPYIKKAAPVIGILVAAFEWAAPRIVVVAQKVYVFVNALPHNVLLMICGLVLCFFGGLYPLMVSAYEAAKVCGGDRMVEAAKTIVEQSKKVLEMNKKDDKADSDGDGVADVKQISKNELLVRKSKLVLQNCDPELVQDAVGALYTSWVGIIAALKIEYARTIALAVSIGSMLRKPATKYALPVLYQAIEADYHKWVRVILDTACKMVGFTIAWTVQRLLSTFQSALRGANMFADGLLEMLQLQGKLPEGFSRESTHVDEIIVWTLAILGCYFQIMVIGFSLPFPISTVLFPFDAVEASLAWSMMSGPTTAVPPA